MDHVKRRGYRTGSEADHIDLGHEPPLSVDGETSDLIDRRRVSVQWFSGTILTGLCGAALMGGAVFASLDGQSNFATVPERVQLALRGSNERAATARKSDRLPPPAETNGQRRVIRDTQTSRVGNREIVRVRAFVRVASNLALSTSELSANIPAFNPLRMQAAETANPGAAPADESPEGEVDAEVSFVTADLANVLPKAKIAAVLSVDDVLVRVREAANWTGSAPSRPVTPEMPRGTRLAYAAEGISDPYAGFEARIAPENVTLLPKTQKEITGGTSWNERTVSVRKGETVASVLRELGARPEDIKAITAALGARGRDGGVREHHKLRVLLAPTDDPKFFQPIRVVIANDSAIEAVVAWSDLGRYVQVDIRNLETEVARSRQQQDEEEDDGRGVRLYQSIYETALRNQVPRPLIEDIIRIYSYDIDFQRRVQPGDSFEILFAGEDEGADAKSEVLFASLTTGGETRRYYRFQSSDDGLVDFYDETGKSAKKFLVRKPLADGIMRSGYGTRNHPLLRYAKMHTGVDWAAPMGTPIYASGNGTIEKLGWEGGYGRYIRIRHANGYQTAYGHMSAFARNMAEGTRVRQGQIIGYVGSTGLSTGAHLHYEIIVNGRTVDPMKFRLPRGRVLEGATLAGFDTERERLDNMISRAGPNRATPPRVAATATTTR
ncbi:MAG TPA: M23 family metallopeptidase [Xanthobacteraceae bacterium]|nr:M23 family metallopeptidase [Xanthobacteraceae bacterium]